MLILIVHAPSWAEGEDRPPGVRPGRWKPRSGPASDFGYAIAKRYSGSFPDPASEGPALPRVRHFQVWNEPNLTLASQWEGDRPASAFIYRRLLNAFYRGIKSVNRSNVVVTGGTAPYGDGPGGSGVRPLLFWRTVMCLRNRDRLLPDRCPERANFDVLAHHPINTSGGPFQAALHPDDHLTQAFHRRFVSRRWRFPRLRLEEHMHDQPEEHPLDPHLAPIADQIAASVIRLTELLYELDLVDENNQAEPRWNVDVGNGVVITGVEAEHPSGRRLYSFIGDGTETIMATRWMHDAVRWEHAVLDEHGVPIEGGVVVVENLAELKEPENPEFN